MKPNGRLDVSQHSIVRVALTHDHAVETERIGDIPIGMFFDDDLAGWYAGPLRSILSFASGYTVSAIILA